MASALLPAAMASTPLAEPLEQSVTTPRASVLEAGQCVPPGRCSEHSLCLPPQGGLGCNVHAPNGRGNRVTSRNGRSGSALCRSEDTEAGPTAVENE